MYQTPQQLEASRPCPVDRAIWAETVAAQKRFILGDSQVGDRFIPLADVCSEIRLSAKQLGRMMDDPTQWPPVPTPIQVTRNRKVFLLKDWIYFKRSILAKQDLHLWETPIIPPRKIPSVKA